MNTILVSILVPVYNTSAYLRKCLDTLIAQTLTQIEIVCVNDGSTDNSLEILKEYAAKDSRIVIVDKPNGGLPSARNAGIEVARGEYVGFVDSDDYVDVNMFKRLYKTAVKNKSEVVVCGAHIFPTDPAPTQWLYNVLSPRTCHYAKFTPDILFKEQGARPFIWRNLIKRDLLIRENIRLKEDIVLGEDQALQFRVYPKAKGISFISDKLYHYCWYRPGSIMNHSSSKIFLQKLEKHVNLCVHVLDETGKGENCTAMQKELLSWSVNLLFDDFIKLSYADRVRIAKRITSTWNSFGYWAHHKGFAPHINDMFDYIYAIAETTEAPTPVDVSILVNLYNSKEYFAEFERSIKNQTLKNLEIVFINNASDNTTYSYLHKWLMSDPRVRIINQAYAPIASTFNEALQQATGKAVIFADAHDLLSSDTVLGDHFSTLIESNADIVCAHQIAHSDKKEDFSNFKLYDFMFKKSFLLDNEIVFENFHSATTKNFATHALALANTIAHPATSKPLFRYRALWSREWLYTEQANDLLRGYLSSLKITSEAKMAKEHLRLVDEINSDMVIQKVLNATNPYLMTLAECPKGENSQSETFRLLCEINRAIDCKLLGTAAVGATKILCEFVNRRNGFLIHTMKF